MKIDKPKLQSAYLAKINQICELCEDKSHFPIEEIVSIISDLLDTGEFYLPPKNSSVLEICATHKKLSPQWGEETRDFVDELYSRLEYAETEVEEVDELLEKEHLAAHDVGYDFGFRDAEDYERLKHDLRFRPQD